MAKNKPETDKGIGWRHIIGGAAVALVVTTGYAFAIRTGFDGFTDSASRFGDSFGGLNTFASALATFGVVLALIMQQKQLTLQREELAMQREELRKAADAQTESARAARAQVAAFGAEGVERFLSEAGAAHRRLAETAYQVKRNPYALQQHHVDAVMACVLPQPPLFCPSPTVHGDTQSACELLGSLRSTVEWALDAFYIRRALGPESQYSQEVGEEARNAWNDMKAHAAEAIELEEQVRLALDDVRHGVRRWYMGEQNRNPESRERPVTTPEAQAS